MSETADTVEQFEEILDRVRVLTGACRTTLRLDWPGIDADVDSVIAESRREGVRSLKGERSLEQRKTAVFKWLDRNRRIFIERDCLHAAADVAPEPEVLEIYGLKAEMVAPLIRNATIVGSVSVHDTRGARDWSGEDTAALETGCQAIQDILDSLQRDAGHVDT